MKQKKIKGVYPRWSRERKKVYVKNMLSQFSSVIVSKMQSIFTKEVHPVQLTRSRSQSSVLPLRPPNIHES